jgi:hypothetical protein
MRPVLDDRHVVSGASGRRAHRTGPASGAFTVEINPVDTVASDQVDLVLRGTAEAVLTAIEHRMAPN